jgi:HPr kinase/phosphorylase
VAGAPPTTLHGALVDVEGMGVLLLGRSGIGKSECALELVSRGHRLVADDIVELRSSSDGRVIGSAPERVRHYMEIRGLGIVFIPDLFGPEGVREEMPIDLVCQLEKWSEGADYERIGLERATQRIGGAEIPRVTLPARPGGSMATVIEVAARDQRQRAAGVNAASRLDAKLRSEMQES